MLAFTIILGLSPFASAFQEKSKNQGKEKTKVQPTGTPVMWRDPGDISTRNLFFGPGGEAMAPDLSKITFIKDETGGYSKKYRVRDARGRVWVAKIGVEAQPETAANRLLWAIGYATEITYLAPQVTIEGKGTFENVRFEARPQGTKRLTEWKWASNPFSGKREFQGLKIMMAFIENWDLKDDNNRVIYVPAAGDNQLQYIVSDLGATFGKTGGQGGLGSFLRNIKGSRNKPEDYAGDKFVEGVEGGRVKLHFSGKMSDIMNDISVEDARWIGSLLSQLTDQQLADAFRAANYPPDDVQLLAQAVRGRINQLVNIPSAGAL